MDTLAGLEQEVIGAAIVAVATLLGRQALSRVRFRRRLESLRALVGRSDHVVLVLPSFEVRGDFRGTERSNIFLMSMPEGAAVARLSAALHAAAPRAETVAVSQHTFNAGKAPFITLGGPSVNEVTRRILASRLPDFEIEYPEHVGRFGGMSLRAVVDADGALIEDYGFVLTGVTPQGCRFVAIWGVMAFGSLAAATAFATGEGRTPTFRETHLVVVKCKVDGTDISDVEVVFEGVR